MTGLVAPGVLRVQAFLERPFGPARLPDRDPDRLVCATAACALIDRLAG